MEFLYLILIWPILLLTLGIVLISLADLNIPGSGFIMFAAVIYLIVLLAGVRREKEIFRQLEVLRFQVATFSIAILLPLFIRYLLLTAKDSLLITLAALASSFLMIIFGMFIKRHKVLAYANIVGGGLSLLYVYVKLWDLGELTRIIAAAAGLIIAVIISIIKLRERLKW